MADELSEEQRALLRDYIDNVSDIIALLQTYSVHDTTEAKRSQEDCLFALLKTHQGLVQQLGLAAVSWREEQ